MNANTNTQPATDLYQQQFEKQANDYAKANDHRPALISVEEARKINVTFPSGQKRLGELTRLKNVRQARWEERNGGTPFDVLTPEERIDADAFFEFMLGGKVKTAPPNPIVEREAKAAAEAKAASDAKLLAESRVKNPPQPAPKAPLSDHAAADQAIVAAETPNPVVGGAVPDPAVHRAAPTAGAPTPIGAHVAIDYTTPDGFPVHLTLYPNTPQPEIPRLITLAGLAVDRLKAAGAKPTTASGPQPMRAEGGAPTCKYHGAMKPSKKPGAYYCPKKLADGSYCDQKYEEGQ